MASNIAPLINDTHAKVERARKAVVEHAVECGRLLTEAKATVAHGKWQDWLTANCTFSARTAQLYMRAFKHLSDGDATKAQRVADFSLRHLDSYLADLERIDREAKAEAGRLGKIFTVGQLQDYLRHFRAAMEDRIRKASAGDGVAT